MVNISEEDFFFFGKVFINLLINKLWIYHQHGYKIPPCKSLEDSSIFLVWVDRYRSQSCRKLKRD